MSSHTLFNKGIFYSFIVMVLWAIEDVAMRYFVVAYDVKPFVFVSLTMLAASVFLIGFAGPGHKGLTTLKRGHTWVFGFTNIAMNIAQLYALIYITSTEMNFLNRMTVLMSLVATWVFLNRKPYKSDILGSIFVFGGLFYIIAGLPDDVRIIAFVTVFISAALSTASAIVGETHQDNVEAEGIKEQARVSGYVLLACSFVFLFVTFLLGFAKASVDPSLVASNAILSAAPDMASFLHKPTFYGAIILGVAVVSLSMYYFFVATKTAKTETFMIVSSCLPFLTFFFEWIASILGLLTIHAISVGDMLAGVVVVAGAFLMQYMRHKEDSKGAKEERRASNDKDDYDMIASSLSFCNGDMLLCAEKLGISAEEIDEVYARKGEVGLKISGNRYKQILRNYHRRIATVDNLTGLSNKETLLRAIEGGLEKNETFAVIFIDLNKFKIVNDTYGHKAGDLALKYVAERLKDNLGDDHVISRIGGDEFAVLLRVTIKKEALKLIVGAVEDMKQPIELENGENVSVGASFGVAMSSDADSAEELLKKADELMYLDKDASR